MSMDASLRSASSLVRHRNVLTRAERLDQLKEELKWDDSKSVYNLPKVGHRKLEIGKGAKDDAAEGDAAATPAAAGAKAPAAGAKGAAAPAAAGKAPAAGAKGAAPAAKAAAPAAKKK